MKKLLLIIATCVFAVSFFDEIDARGGRGGGGGFGGRGGFARGGGFRGGIARGGGFRGGGFRRGFVGGRGYTGGHVGTVGRGAVAERSGIGAGRRAFGGVNRSGGGIARGIQSGKAMGLSRAQQARLGQIGRGNLGAGRGGMARSGGKRGGMARPGRPGGMAQPGGVGRAGGGRNLLGNHANRGNLAHSHGLNHGGQFNRGYFNRFNNFWWGGLGLGLGFFGWWALSSFFLSPWWWWGLGGYNPWYFDSLQPVQIVDYQSMPETDQAVYVQQENTRVSDALYRLTSGLQQQADAIISLADQMNDLDARIGVQHQPIETAPAAQNSNDLVNDLNYAADAIKVLAQYALDDQQKLGIQLGNVDLQNIDVPALITASAAQSTNSYREIARNQARALNQIASLVVRMQRQAGIVPEGGQQMLSMQQQDGGEAQIPQQIQQPGIEAQMPVQPMQSQMIQQSVMPINVQ